MKRIVLLVILCSFGAVAQVTPNLNLNLPVHGTLNWDVPVNQNSTLLDQYLTGTLTIPLVTKFTNVIDLGLTANAGVVCTDSNKMLTTSGCSGGPGGDISGTLTIGTVPRAGDVHVLANGSLTDDGVGNMSVPGLITDLSLNNPNPTGHLSLTTVGTGISMSVDDGIQFDTTNGQFHMTTDADTTFNIASLSVNSGGGTAPINLGGGLTTVGSLQVTDGLTLGSGISINGADGQSIFFPVSGNLRLDTAVGGNSEIALISTANIGTPCTNIAAVTGCVWITSANTPLVLSHSLLSSHAGGLLFPGESSGSIGVFAPDAGSNTTVVFQSISGLFQIATALPFASLPTCDSPHEGIDLGVTDSNTNTWGASVAGGGANHIGAHCNGTAWTVYSK